jgi:hypothetical protein
MVPSFPNLSRMIYIGSSKGTLLVRFLPPPQYQIAPAAAIHVHTQTHLRQVIQSLARNNVKP